MGEKPKIVSKLLAIKLISGMISTFRQWFVHKSRRALAGPKDLSIGEQALLRQNISPLVFYTSAPDDGAGNCSS